MKKERAARHAREIAPGIHWLGCCGRTEYRGVTYHTQVSTYLVVGGSQTLLVDTGTPSDWPFVEQQLDGILQGRPLDWLVPTHTELPHSGNFARLMRKYPTARAIGDNVDFHLFYPEHESRLLPWPMEQPLDLGGGHEVTLLRARIADLPATQWAYESSQGVMFVADGCSWMHHVIDVGGEGEVVHRPSECGRLTGELPEPPAVHQAERMTVTALGWARTREATDVLREMDALLRRYPARFLAPTHGNVISDSGTFLRILAAAFHNSFHASNPE